MLSKIIPVLLAILFGISAIVWAHPPTKIGLSYDQVKKVLKIEIEHTRTKKNHFIRKISITKNDEAPLDIYLAKQTSNDGTTEEVPLEAKSGDQIHVRAYSFESGFGEETLIVPDLKNQIKK